MKIIFPLVALLVLSVIINAKVPDFKIKSGDNRLLTQKDIANRNVVLFYESREASKENLKLKEKLFQLKEKTDKEGNTPFILAVADCSAVSWPLTSLWEKVMVDISKKQGFTIYGDWDGGMLKAYNFRKNQSNFMIIDKNGFIKYRAFGKIADAEIEKIITMVDDLG
jgi:hypothetical protein